MVTQFPDVYRTGRVDRHSRAIGGVALVLRTSAKHPLATAGVVFILACTFGALFAEALAPHARESTDLNAILAPPSAEHWMGTDEIGRDSFTRLLYGARVSLEVGLLSVLVAVSVGVLLGLLAAYARGLTESLIVTALDAMIAFPALILALALLTAFGPGTWKVILAISITSIPAYARILRAQALSVSSLDYVLAARSTGASQIRLMARHILPNSLSPLIVQASIGLGAAVLAEAGLSFLGVGVQPPQPSWGTMLQKGFIYIHRSPWASIFPGLAIFLVVLSFNFIGDALRDRLDPKLRGR